ncbi:hypothetical protein COLO4_01664, partial [Corchorus olitorius]
LRFTPLRMFGRNDRIAFFQGIDLGKLCPEKDQHAGIIDPHHNQDDRTGGTKC